MLEILRIISLSVFANTISLRISSDLLVRAPREQLGYLLGSWLMMGDERVKQRILFGLREVGISLNLYDSIYELYNHETK